MASLLANTISRFSLQPSCDPPSSTLIHQNPNTLKPRFPNLTKIRAEIGYDSSATNTTEPERGTRHQSTARDRERHGEDNSAFRASYRRALMALSCHNLWMVANVQQLSGSRRAS
ncbi:uncharacterized protein LOC110733217 isoform X2 [Chenopodium quinoa]|uniref:uncharacterized protein LOC110733217 isoform X2 n=1 Tax=Chenopodium quinoa TaxID=63459 RepID=UPI000B76B8E9|nr:uncharacterized protein LOC110733217 isoform X2 [Chenopodium quinoa]